MVRIVPSAYGRNDYIRRTRSKLGLIFTIRTASLLLQVMRLCFAMEKWVDVNGDESLVFYII